MGSLHTIACHPLQPGQVAVCSANAKYFAMPRSGLPGKFRIRTDLKHILHKSARMTAHLLFQIRPCYIGRAACQSEACIETCLPKSRLRNDSLMSSYAGTGSVVVAGHLLTKCKLRYSPALFQINYQYGSGYSSLDSHQEIGSPTATAARAAKNDHQAVQQGVDEIAWQAQNIYSRTTA